MRTVAQLAVAALALLAFACSSTSDGPLGFKRPHAGSVSPVVVPVAAAPTMVHGDADRGGALVLKFQCNRCHEGTGHAASTVRAFEQHCFRCHEDISTGKFGAGTPKVATWKERVAPYRYAPSLESAGKRFRTEWLAQLSGSRRISVLTCPRPCRGSR